MSKKYIVRWSNSAEGDLNEILEYIANDNIDKALEIFYRIKDESNNLYKHPTRGRIVPELLLHNIDSYKEIIIFPWRIIYKIELNSVNVLTVIDGRRNVEDILLKKVLIREL